VKIYNYKLLYPSFLFPGKTQFDESKKLVKSIPSERIVNSISPFNWLRVAGKLKKENADIVVFDWWHPFFSFCHFTISTLIKGKYKRKILFITENVISHEGNLPDKILTSIGLNNADSFLALSDDVVKSLNSYNYKQKIYRSELPVYDWYKTENNEQNNSLKANLGFKEEDKILLFFGYVRKYKGLDILIEAMKMLVDEEKKYKLLIVGEFYDDPKIYKDQINRLGLNNNIQIINEYVPNEEVGKYFNISDVVVLPYRSATQSGILNIAYGFNKPVIVTKVGGLTESVEDGKTGIVVDEARPDKIAGAVKKFYSLAGTINFKENVAKAAQQNSFNKISGIFEQIILDMEK
jgi:glycosyltransferase involved in cell wall biosynthesis